MDPDVAIQRRCAIKSRSRDFELWSWVGAEQLASVGAVQGKWIDGPSRWQVSGWHLLISAFVAVARLALTLEVWFPRPLFEAAGGANLLFILVGVDVVIGPLMTLTIFDTATKSARALKFDLAVIAFLQLTALGYGLYTLFEARPVFIVYTNDRLDVVTPSEIPPQEMAKVARREFRSLPLGGPRLVAAEFPADANEQNRILLSALSGGPDLHCFPQHYRPYETALERVRSYARPVSELIRRHPEGRSELERRSTSLGRRLEDLRYLPVRAKVNSFTALIDPATGNVLEYAMVDPW
jgi:hypothetical protein